MQTTIRRLVLLLALLGVWGGAGGSAARAEDDAKPLSPAEQAYKDAWWAETGGGNLNEALALYAKAATAEGPAGIKARALYKQAVIQQRIGKTEEAIQTLERLAKEHPGEANVQADARDLLAEWTAVDLRTGFPEWYRRFQYGPEFQAKILDLVLKLGGNTHADVMAARQEILTIGEPAMPALRAHLGTRNTQLASQVVDTLMQFGEVPDEIVGHPYGTWAVSQPSWALILDLPAERRAALLTRLGSALESENAQALAAVLQGPAACVEFLARLSPIPADQSYPQSRWRIRGACLDRVDAGGPISERVRALVAAGVPDGQVWSGFARWVIEKGLVTRADVDAWASLPWDTAAGARVQALRDPKLFPPSEAWQVLREVIAARNVATAQSHRWLLDALTALLPDLPWPEARDEVARALGPLLADLTRFGQGHLLPSDRLLDALGRAFELARDPTLIQACGGAWVPHGAGRPGGLETLFRWAREGALAAHRSWARAALFPRLGERDLDAAVDLLVKPETVDDDLLSAWQELMALPQGGAVVGSPARGWRLLDRIAAVPPGERARAEKLAIHLLFPVNGGRVPPTALLDRWLEQPERFPAVVLSTQKHSLPKLLAASGQLPALRSAFRERWVAGTPAQREGLLAGLGVLDPRADPELLEFLRGELAAQPRRIPVKWRYSVVARLLKLTVADIRAFYDLTQPAEVDEAASWVTRTQDAPILEATPEAFEALRLAFRPEGPNAEGLVPYFERFEAIQRPLLEMLLAHAEADTRQKGVNLLITRSSPTDADLWVKALTDPKVSIRSSAAQELKRVPTSVTIKALVGALDDPHPDVRAAALSSLDSIQKMEELKARWREKVK